MLDIQQKRKLRSFLYHKATLVVLFILVALSIHSTWSVYEKKRSSEEMKEMAMGAVTDLKQRNDDLDSKISKLATISGIEEEIRLKFSVTKDEERLIVVLPEKEEGTSTGSENEGFFKKLMRIFGF